MHSRVFITFDKNKAQNSLEARKFLYRCIGEKSKPFDKIFYDYYAIGGRYTGFFEALYNGGINLLTKVIQEANSKNIETSIIQKRTISKEEQLSNFRDSFRKYYPKYKGEPFFTPIRELRELGYEDDAMIIDNSVYDWLLKEYEGKKFSLEYNSDDFLPCTVDIEGNEVAEDVFVNKKWIVIADFHK